jgi:DNA-binding NarL/FixJ family response regulator
MERLRLVVADDHSAFLGQIVSLLAAECDVVATASDGRSALDLIRRYNPDVVVLDIGMPVLDGIEVTRELGKDQRCPCVVICSVETDLAVVETAQEAGALGYVFKARVGIDLMLAVNSAVQGKPFVSQPLK